MRERILQAKRVAGSIRLPGDKSISHRYAMLSGVAEGTSRIRNYATGDDCGSTLSCLRALGVRVERHGSETLIHGRGLEGLRQPSESLNAGNSGSTIRMLSGILAGQRFSSRISGDESLCRRPMDRIIRPLSEMGASVQAREGRFPPLEIRGGKLRPIDYPLPIASAQVKTCILFGGLFANGRTTVREPLRTRDHTEIALREFGAEVEVKSGTISVEGRQKLAARELEVPGDLSSAVFFLAAALLVPDAELVIESVGLNPTRSVVLDFLVSMGAQIQIFNVHQSAGELTGNISAKTSRLAGGVIETGLTAALIDEIPMLAVLGAASDEGLVVRDAAELRVKETDRIAAVAENCRRMGVIIDVQADGFSVPGRQPFRASEFDSFGDHRIAMTFAVAALRANGDSVIEGAEAASVSFPGFFDLLRRVSV
jgi:3-phosphoshikimate 1-carboxyvinyltransferase